MLNPFWNRKQHRIRAGWRILLHGLLYILLSSLLSGAIFLASTVVASTSPGDENMPLAMQINRFFVPVASVAAAVLVLWIAGKIFDRRCFADFGFHLNRNWWIDFVFGLGLGGLLMLLIFLAELSAGWVKITSTFSTSSTTGIPFAIAAFFGLWQFIAVGINEEIMSRGYHLRNLAEGLNLAKVSPRTALILGYAISSSMFGIFHLGNANATWISTFNIAIAGMMLGLGYVLTGELAIPIGLHISWNFFQGRVFGFPVSGGASQTSFIAVQQSGPDLWTGGAFGPEAGLIGLLAILLGCLLTWLWVKRRYGCAKLQDELAVYCP